MIEILEAYYDTKFCVTGVDLFYTSYFGRGSGPILFAYLDCDGSESRLSDCSTSSSYNFGTSHSNDAGMRCQPSTVASENNKLVYMLRRSIIILTEFF